MNMNMNMNMNEWRFYGKPSLFATRGVKWTSWEVSLIIVSGLFKSRTATLQVMLSVGQLVGLSFRKSLSRLVGQLVSQWVCLSVNLSVNRFITNEHSNLFHESESNFDKNKMSVVCCLSVVLFFQFCRCDACDIVFMNSFVAMSNSKWSVLSRSSVCRSAGLQACSSRKVWKRAFSLLPLVPLLCATVSMYPEGILICIYSLLNLHDTYLAAPTQITSFFSPT